MWRCVWKSTSAPEGWYVLRVSRTWSSSRAISKFRGVGLFLLLADTDASEPSDASFPGLPPSPPARAGEELPPPTARGPESFAEEPSAPNKVGFLLAAPKPFEEAIAAPASSFSNLTISSSILDFRFRRSIPFNMRYSSLQNFASGGWQHSADSSRVSSSADSISQDSNNARASQHSISSSSGLCAGCSMEKFVPLVSLSTWEEVDPGLLLPPEDAAPARDPGRLSARVGPSSRASSPSMATSFSIIPGPAQSARFKTVGEK
mmetsp:Transcript_18009/g.45014  ORF Transcript_18009/g.45014 Transcript_18009/m.45014 type:complete len:262 (-) Transcript_18009:675-1460(-)